jgi:hypothetical protein
MKKFIYYILPFFLLGLGACKKMPLPPENTTNEPVFYSHFIMDEKAVDIDASRGYYMNAAYSQDANGVYVYSGEMKQTGSPATGYSIEFRINDDSVSAMGAAMKPDRALMIGKHEFNDGSLPPLGYYGNFKAAGSSTWDYEWYNNGVLTSTVATLNSFFIAGSQTVSLKAASQTATADVLQNTYQVGNNLQVNVSAVRPSPDFSFVFTPTSTVFNGLSYFWQYGDGTSESSGGPTHMYTVSVGNYYKMVTLTTNAGGQTCVTNYQVPLFYDLNRVHSNFTSTFTPVQNSMGLGAASIVITDPAGNKYSSSALDQTSGTKFEIVSVEDYHDNEAGDKIKKVKIKFSCKLKAANGFIKEVPAGEAVVAVAYKP